MNSRLLTLVALIVPVFLGTGNVGYAVEARSFASIEDSVEGFEFDVDQDAGWFSAGPTEVKIDRVSGHSHARVSGCKGALVGFKGKGFAHGWFRDGRGPKHFYNSASCSYASLESSGHSYIIDAPAGGVVTFRVSVPMVEEHPFPDVEPTAPIGNIPIQGMFADGPLDVSLNVNAALRQGGRTFQSIMRGHARLAGPMSSRPGLYATGDLVSAFRETQGQTRNSAILDRAVEKTVRVKTNEVFEIVLYYHVGTGPHPTSPPCDGDCPLLDIPDGQEIGTAASLTVELDFVDLKEGYTVRRLRKKPWRHLLPDLK